MSWAAGLEAVSSFYFLPESGLGAGGGGEKKSKRRRKHGSDTLNLGFKQEHVSIRK